MGKKRCKKCGKKKGKGCRKQICDKCDKFKRHVDIYNYSYNNNSWKEQKNLCNKCHKADVLYAITGSYSCYN